MNVTGIVHTKCASMTSLLPKRYQKVTYEIYSLPLGNRHVIYKLILKADIMNISNNLFLNYFIVSFICRHRYGQIKR